MTAAGLATIVERRAAAAAPSRCSIRSPPPTPASSSGWPAAWRRRIPSTRSATRRSRSACRSRRSSRTFPAIDTVVDNIKFTEGLENVAKVMDRGTLIRSHVVADLGNILHSRHQYHWHTGYVPPQTVACPHIGAWMARVLGPRNPAIPPFINIGQRLEGDRRAGGAEGVHHRRLLRQRVRAVQPAVPRRCGRRRPPAEGHDAGALRGAAREVPGTAEGQPGRRNGQRPPARIDAALDRERPPAAHAARNATPST